MPPCFAAANAISRSMSPGLVTSVATKRASPPSVAISATRLSPSAARRLAATIAAPCRAKARAVARPMPLPAPGVTTILPARSDMAVQHRRALDDALELGRGIEHAENVGAVALQPRGTEHLEHF